MASGAPAIVSDKGGPKFFVTDGVNGFVAGDLDDFAKYATRFLDEPELLAKMRETSRQFALTRSWDSVFEGVYSAYAEASDYLASVRERQRREREAKSQTA
jgi:glycosyltransferase involved in cell wall biosynthesis